MEDQIVALSSRIADLEGTVQVLSVVVGLLTATLVTIGVSAAMWFRSRHSEVVSSIEGLSQGQTELCEEVRYAQVSRVIRDQGRLH